MDRERKSRSDLLAQRFSAVWSNVQTAVSVVRAGEIRTVKQLRHLRKVKPRQGARPPTLVPVVARKLSRKLDK